jgi:nucleotide-binding universal stress UspA family protein
MVYSKRRKALMTVDNSKFFLICYDGSEDSKRAISQAAQIFDLARPALVVTVWQSTMSGMGGASWAGLMTPMIDYVELDKAQNDDAARIAEEGASLARKAGFEVATSLAVKSRGPIWEEITTFAKERDVVAIVMGSRGLTGVRKVLVGSVSAAVVAHADRPVVIVQHACPAGK